VELVQGMCLGSALWASYSEFAVPQWCIHHCWWWGFWVRGSRFKTESLVGHM